MVGGSNLSKGQSFELILHVHGWYPDMVQNQCARFSWITLSMFLVKKYYRKELSSHTIQE